MDLIELGEMKRMGKKNYCNPSLLLSALKDNFYRLALECHLHEICKVNQELQTAGVRGGTTDFLISILLTNS